MFALLIALVSVAWFVMLLVFAGASGGNFGTSPMGGIGGIWMVVGGLIYLAILVPGIAVQVRRFHDQNKSGWLTLINFVPYVGGFIVLAFMMIEGTRGPNRFGADPKDPHGIDGIAEVFS